MSTLGQLLRAIPATAAVPRAGEDARVASTLPEPEAAAAERCAAFPTATARDEQIHSLVHQLFLQQDTVRVRNVCFAPVEGGATAAHLCVDVAQALALQGKYDVGLIDGGSGSVHLHELLQIPVANRGDARWQVAPSLWMVPRGTWSKECGAEPITDRKLEWLRDSMAEFDFSVLCCAPVSWLTMRIAQACDGLVLVLAANKTRRLVATQVKEKLTKAHIPLLGTVLAERRLPVPEKLYRVL